MRRYKTLVAGVLFIGLWSCDSPTPTTQVTPPPAAPQEPASTLLEQRLKILADHPAYEGMCRRQFELDEVFNNSSEEDQEQKISLCVIELNKSMDQ